MPDPISYTKVPFKPGLARLACDVTVEGAAVAVLPAHHPAHANERALKHGYRLKMGMELEFFLVRGGGRQDRRARRPSTRSSSPATT